jgi:hypothetical protein
MNIAYFPNQIARNAPPVLEAFLHSCRVAGYKPVADSMTADAAVIWSQVWAGKMQKNQQVWQEYRRTGRPVFVLEVGSLQRDITWRVGLNGAHSIDHFNSYGNGPERAQMLQLKLEPWKKLGNYVMICAQRADSEQWAGQTSPELWVESIIKQLKIYTTRPIVVRPHPRFRFNRSWAGVSMYQPQRVSDTYDGYDFDASLINAHAVINWNSGPGLRAVLHGVPAFVGHTSLARAVGNTDISRIETPLRPDRQQWLNDLAYTEWTVDEISQGLPLQQLHFLVK